jgi:hypothetical protein
MRRVAWLVAVMAGAVLAAAQEVPSKGPWPMNLESGTDRITVYAPEWESLEGGDLRGRAAVSMGGVASGTPLFGAVELWGEVLADREARTVRVFDIHVTRARFPELEGTPAALVEAALRREIGARPLVLPLEGLLARPPAFEDAPPRIVFRDRPAVLVTYDGEPRLAEVEGFRLLRAVNTPFLVVLDPATRTYYLRGVGRWFGAATPLGPFRETGAVPRDVESCAAGSGAVAEPVDDPRAATVEIVTATEPTELVWTDGPPEYVTVAGTDLLAVANTESDVFMDILTQRLYVLLSGRWYRAAGWGGPWEPVAPDRLPEDFAKIPPGGAKGRVLAHVGGTEAARDAVLDGAVPRTATVDRASAARPEVVYDGEPRFVEAGHSTVRYAVNTVFSVLEFRGTFYCCWEGVWFVASHPLGPWAVCTWVPDELYGLPAECPLYPVRYVVVYEVRPAWVMFGYRPGYFGCYPWRGVVVYGTGHRYRGWCGGRWYYPRPCTWGFAAHYDSWGGCWGYSVGWGGPSLWLNLRIGSGGWAVGGSFGIHTGGGWWGYGGYCHVRTSGPAPCRAEAPVSLYDRRPDARGGAVRPSAPVRGRSPVQVWDRDGGRGTVVMPERPGTGRPPASGRSGSERPPASERPQPGRSGYERPPADRPREGRSPVERSPSEPPRVERPSVERPGGDRPGFERPLMERPQPGRSWLDGLWGNRTPGGRPAVERPEVERPPAGRSGFERIQEDAPREERPRFDRPEEDRPRVERPEPPERPRPEARPRVERSPQPRPQERTSPGRGASGNSSRESRREKSKK